MFGIDDLVGGAVSAFGQMMANKQQQKMADKQMAFQERMSSTSWQRGVDDMRKAGINPMLAVSQGGASSPGGAMADVGDVVGAGVSSARAQQLQRSEVALRAAQTDNQLQSAFKAMSEGLKAQAELPDTWHFDPRERSYTRVRGQDGPVGPGGSSYALRSGLNAARIAGLEASAKSALAMSRLSDKRGELIDAGMPAARTRGASWWPYWELGLKTVNSAAGAYRAGKTFPVRRGVRR